MMASARGRWIGFVALAVALLTAAICGDAAAKAGNGHRHARSPVAATRERENADSVQLLAQQPARRGPMRYYGGPKSPMWRGPVEN
jgi:hypothetical protein